MVIFNSLWKVLTGANPVTSMFVYTAYVYTCIYVFAMSRLTFTVT